MSDFSAAKILFDASVWSLALRRDDHVAHPAVDVLDQSLARDSAVFTTGLSCRRHGVQIDTVDALLAQLCIAYDLVMLTTDHDFAHLARHAPLKIWSASTPNTPP